MIRQVIFFIVFLTAAGIFTWTSFRIFSYFRITKGRFPFDRIPQRIIVTLLVALGQTKIFRKPLAGLLHALVWWGFIVITIGTSEMILDGLTGYDRCYSGAGWFYDILTASGDIFAPVILLCCIFFLLRRIALHIRRFYGVEMKKKSKIDALIALSLISLLMISLTGMNTGYLLLNENHYDGYYPVSVVLSGYLSSINPGSSTLLYEAGWWSHIVLVFLFLNVLPYSKHFHVIMSVPNVFLSKLEPMMKMENMDEITSEIRQMLAPPQAGLAPESEPPAAPSAQPSRFGIRDAEDISWKNLADSLSCTECGRCTDVCPASTTGKLLSPRKIMMDARKRMYEKGIPYSKDKEFNDGKSLVNDYISREELWACTTCHACVQECPVNIDHVSLISGLRRYLVMEEANVPPAWTMMFNNIENNGAPWQYSPSDRLRWADILDFKVPTMAGMALSGEKPEFLFWVGCAGSFDDRSKKVTAALAKVLHAAGIKFAVLGEEESCTGDPARRSGNEYLFQMQAIKNIRTLSSYEVKKIVTACPHCYNTLKNEYPDLGGHYRVQHHSEVLTQLFNEGRLRIAEKNIFDGKRITWHDPCYLGRGAGIYEIPRQVIRTLGSDVMEMERNRSKGFCCGAGGGQMFKEAEKGNKEVNVERTEEALAVKPDVITVGCPYCMTMMSDGLKHFNREENVRVFDIAEMAAARITP
ncbi:MAG: (Fe-S)-binding protein [Bacteroidetes bacterium]|nr:(Fe-S)-binding protein [Bacteroidota bacterium]